MFKLAHISDLHIGPLPRPGLVALRGKRLLGFLSWQIRRRHQHRPEVLEALLRDLQAQRPDHVAITGDLVNLALSAEFVQAAAWLGRLGPPGRVTLVPGNHDALVPVRHDDTWVHVAPYMTGDEHWCDGAIAFPFLRRRGPLALVGLSTANPTSPGLATGRLGPAQLAALDRCLAGIDPDEICRVVLLHHPPVEDGSSPRRRLVDAAELRRLLAERGAELVLHGHAHRASVATIDGSGDPIAVVGGASASRLARARAECATYQTYAIERADGAWRIEIEVRQYDPATGTFAPVDPAATPMVLSARR